MSSNSAKPPAAAEEASPSRRSWSLTLRLALFTALSSFVILAVVSVHLYSVLADQLKTQNSFFLREEIAALSGMGRFPEFHKMLAEEIRIDHAGEEYLTHYIRFLNDEGKTMLETPAMDAILPRSLFPPPGQDGAFGKEVAVRKPDGSSFILTSVMLDTGNSGRDTGMLQVALDVSNVEKVLGRHRNQLAASLLAGFLLCVGAGLVIARRGTHPIREITEIARLITTDCLDERLVGAKWPREVSALADALNGMLARLQDSFSRLYNSAANLSHKLRTPITVIRGEAEVALAGERTAEELREVIASSVEECERLTHLVDNIVFIAQVEANKLQHVLVKIKARTEIDKVLDFYAPLAEEKGIAVTCKGHALLAADPALFRKAVANLLTNALTFTPLGGSVDVNVWQDDDGSVALLVHDTGCGIAEQEISKIFDRFYRVYDTRYLAPHGSGLGLSLVKTIMDLHNGAVEIRSLPGEGTTAALKFPPVAPPP